MTEPAEPKPRGRLIQPKDPAGRFLSPHVLSGPRSAKSPKLRVNLPQHHPLRALIHISGLKNADLAAAFRSIVKIASGEQRREAHLQLQAARLLFEALGFIQPRAFTSRKAKEPGTLIRLKPPKVTQGQVSDTVSTESKSANGAAANEPAVVCANEAAEPLESQPCKSPAGTASSCSTPPEPPAEAPATS